MYSGRVGHNTRLTIDSEQILKRIQRFFGLE